MLLYHALVTSDSACFVAVSMCERPSLDLRYLRRGTSRTGIVSILAVQVDHLLLLLLVTLSGAR